MVKVNKSSELRLDRIIIDKEDVYLKIGETQYELCDYNEYGIALYRSSPFPSRSEEISGFIYVEDLMVSELKLKFAREEQLADKSYKTAFEILNGPLNINQIDAVTNTKGSLSALEEELKKLDKMSAEFKNLVFETKEFLLQLQDQISGYSLNYQYLSRDQIVDIENSVSSIVAKFLLKYFQDLYGKVSKCLEGQSEKNNQASFEFFRKHVGSILVKSPFARRALEKPLNYAGDFEMMNILYRNESLGDDLFSRCIHRYFLENPEAKAVRNRTQYLSGKILSVAKNNNEKAVRILSVASGPAMELQLLVQKHPELDYKNLSFHLLDQDPVSLKHAKLKLKEHSRKSGIDLDIRFFNSNTRQASRRDIGLFPHYDLIYSAGLFDYFPDEIAIQTARYLVSLLEPGGKLIIGNFNLVATNIAMMDIAFDWKLIYRTRKDLTRLFGDLGHLTIEEEAEGINLFCVLTS